VISINVRIRRKRHDLLEHTERMAEAGPKEEES
jgi:hypothetical protein